MNIFSRRKRLLNRTSARINSGPTAHGRGRIRRALWRDRAGVTVTGQASGRARFRKIFRRNRAGTPVMPKMSSRRQFHRALRRHPAWPAVMEQAAARAKSHEEQLAARERLIKQQAAAQKQLRRAARRAKFHWLAHRNRTSVMVTGQAPSRIGLRRAIRRNRAGVIALVGVGALVALLGGIGGAAERLWQLQRPDLQASRPGARFGAATTFDLNKDEMLIFGGFGTHGGPTTLAGLHPAINGTAFGDTWGWSGEQVKWRDRNPIHAPSPRGFAAMAYDAARGNVVLFGGAKSTSIDSAVVLLGDTWVWDGQDWTLQEPAGARPEARQQASMVYDAHRKVVVLYGGQGRDNFTVFDDTWTWDGSVWKKLDVSGPPARGGAAISYDMCRAETVLFGGDGVPSTSTDLRRHPEPSETWTFNGTEWTLETPSLSPTPRIGASMSYSPWSDRVLLYGGLFVTEFGRPTVASDDNLWAWNGTTWEKEIPGLSYGPEAAYWTANSQGHPGGMPPPRGYASFAADPNRPHAANNTGSIHLFGGTPGRVQGTFNGSGPQVSLLDQWAVKEDGFEYNPLEPPFESCANPVPIPPDDIVGNDEKDEDSQASKTATRTEIREVGKLPVLLGTDPKTIPAGSPKPPCLRRPGEEIVANTHLITDPQRNRVYQFFLCQLEKGISSSQDIQRLLIQAYDGVTLKPLGSALVVVGANTTDTSLPQVMHDAVRGRLLFRSEASGSELVVIQQDLLEKGADPVAGRITLPRKPEGTESPFGISFFDHPKTGRDKLLISYEGTPPMIVQWDLQNQTEDWRRPLDPGCKSMLYKSGHQVGKMMRSGDRVYATCVTVLQDIPQHGVVKITVAEQPNGSETPATPEVFPGPYSVRRIWVDPQAERVLLLSSSQAASTSSTLWTFDGKASRYVGRSGVDVSLRYGGRGLGLDAKTGRFYGLVPDQAASGYGSQNTGAKNPGGLLMFDIRLTPPPQASKFTQFSRLGEADIAVLPPKDGLPTRVFVRRAAGHSPSDPSDPDQVKATADTMRRYPDGEVVALPDEMYYLVLEDNYPVAVQPALEQQDALTVPVAESAKTEANFDAGGSGYGIRLRSVGGVHSALRPFPQANATELYDGSTTGRSSEIPPCFYPDRELMAGWVAQASLSDLSASALSLGLEVDDASKADLQGPSTRCVPPAVGPNALPDQAKLVTDDLWPLLPFTQLDQASGSVLAWDKHFKEAECSGDPTATKSETNKATLGDAYGSVTCKQKEARVDATARGALAGSLPSGYSVTTTQNTAPAELPAPVEYSVGEGYSTVTVARDPIKGVVVTSTAWAKAIKLPSISIDLVKTEAVTWSNGRPGEKRATFKRTICGVNRPDSPSTVTSTSCLSEENQQKMVNDWNARGGVNSKMSRPEPDPNLFKGSAGGYIAGVIKPLAAELEDQLFAKDFQREVAGLEIVFYKDSATYGPARQVLQLAAVGAVAGYGVQCTSDLIYSPSAKSCVPIPEDVYPEEFETEETFATEEADEGAFNTYDDEGSGWTQIATGAPEGLPLGKRLGRFIANLPIIRQLPIRQMGEALLAGSVWLLLTLPFALTARRFALNLARGR